MSEPERSDIGYVAESTSPYPLVPTEHGGCEDASRHAIESIAISEIDGSSDAALAGGLSVWKTSAQSWQVSRIGLSNHRRQWVAQHGRSTPGA